MDIRPHPKNPFKAILTVENQDELRQVTNSQHVFQLPISRFDIDFLINRQPDYPRDITFTHRRLGMMAANTYEPELFHEITGFLEQRMLAERPIVSDGPPIRGIDN